MCKICEIVLCLKWHKQGLLAVPLFLDGNREGEKVLCSLDF